MSFVQQGHEFRILVALAPEKSAQPSYLRGYLPDNLESGIYRVELTGAEYEEKDGQLVPAPKTNIRAFYQFECYFPAYQTAAQWNVWSAYQSQGHTIDRSLQDLSTRLKFLETDVPKANPTHDPRVETNTRKTVLGDETLCDVRFLYNWTPSPPRNLPAPSTSGAFVAVTALRYDEGRPRDFIPIKGPVTWDGTSERRQYALDSQEFGWKFIIQVQGNQPDIVKKANAIIDDQLTRLATALRPATAPAAPATLTNRETLYYQQLYDRYKTAILADAKAGNTAAIAKTTAALNESLGNNILLVDVSTIDADEKVTPVFTLRTKRPQGMPINDYGRIEHVHITKINDYILLETSRIEPDPTATRPGYPHYADGIYIKLALAPIPAATQPAPTTTQAATLPATASPFGERVQGLQLRLRSNTEIEQNDTLSAYLELEWGDAQGTDEQQAALMTYRHKVDITDPISLEAEKNVMEHVRRELEIMRKSRGTAAELLEQESAVAAQEARVKAAQDQLEQDKLKLAQTEAAIAKLKPLSPDRLDTFQYPNNTTLTLRNTRTGQSFTITPLRRLHGNALPQRRQELHPLQHRWQT